jgi:hypothetical protein
MKPDELDARMRALESFHTPRFPPGAWVILPLRRTLAGRRRNGDARRCVQVAAVPSRRRATTARIAGK